MTIIEQSSNKFMIFRVIMYLKIRKSDTSFIMKRHTFLFFLDFIIQIQFGRLNSHQNYEPNTAPDSSFPQILRKI